MTEQTIKIDGIPEGYKAVSVTLDPGSRSYHDEAHIKNTATVTLEKIKPRRLVFEETLKSNNTGNCQVFLSNNENGILTRVSIASDLLWREVKETDIPLNSDGSKLSLSVDEYKDLQVICDVKLSRKIQDFIKDHLI